MMSFGAESYSTRVNEFRIIVRYSDAIDRTHWVVSCNSHEIKRGILNGCHEQAAATAAERWILGRFETLAKLAGRRAA
jgi:hypothetical protein